MKISELSPISNLPPDPQTQTLSEIESLINQSESSNPNLPLLISNLQTTLTKLTSFSPLSQHSKLQIWKLTYRLWNSCVDLSNTLYAPKSKFKNNSNERDASTSPSPSFLHLAKLRNVAADFLNLAGDVEGIPSPGFKAALFYYKTGCVWHELGKFELAASCYERATGLTKAYVEVEGMEKVKDVEEQRLLLDINIARAVTAWEIKERNVAIALLGRGKSVLFGSAESYSVLANQYLVFGKDVLASNLNECLKLMNECLELCEKGLLRVARLPIQQLGLRNVKSKCLRFMAAAHLQGEEYENVLKCIKVLREDVGGEGSNHPCLPVLAMKAWLGLKRYKEAEKELRGMVVNKGIPETIWVSAVESYFQEVGVAGAETAKGLFLGLLDRCHVSAGAAVRVAQKVAGSGGGEVSRVRAKVVAELVSDDRVVALFEGDEAVNERTAMHAVLWNCGADHFRVKDYETGADMFEKSMLYVPHNIENKIVRAKCFRVLCLCYLGLSQLDQAQEFINEADKLHPNIACAFLKFKIYLQKNKIDSAVDQLQAMPLCLDFTPDFFILSAHESIASQALPVTIAALSTLLNFYSNKLMPTPQVVVLRTLVTVLSRESGNEDQVLKFTKMARTRMLELGAEEFFGKGEVGRREQNWFSVNSWNIGTRIGREKKYEFCAELLELASDFYGVTEDNQSMVCKSLILSVSAMIAVEKQRNSSLLESEVKHAIEMLEKAGKILATLSYGSKLTDDPTTIEPNFFFVYIFNSYDLRGRLSDSSDHQLHLIKNFASSKVCTPQYLLHIGLTALQGPRINIQVADFALNTCLSTLLSMSSPNYRTIAIILRKLIGFVGFKKGDGDDEMYSVYKQAYQIMVGLKKGEYPSEEGKWLAMTAWNRAAMPVRLNQIRVARRWMKIGLELSQHVPDMGAFTECMEEFLAEFEKIFEGHDDGCS